MNSPLITCVEKSLESSVKITPLPMVEFEQTKYCYYSRNKKVHWHFGPSSLEIGKGELLVILGPSGSGKTTMLRLIAGLESPKKGIIRIDGQPVFNQQIHIPPESRKVGFMFQDHALFPHLTVRENILFGIEGWNKDQRESRLSELKEFLGIGAYLNRYPHELSGGQQQRVALARTLAPKPKVILLDEPLSHIDADLRSNLAQELKGIIKQAAATAVWVTHDRAEAFDIADRIAILKDGTIEQIDEPLNLYHKPKTRFVAEFIGCSSFIKGEFRRGFVLTEIGVLPCMFPFGEGQKIEVMIRPEELAVTAHHAGIGMIAKRQFRGSRHLYTVVLPSGQEVLGYQPSTVIWPQKTQVHVAVKSQGVVGFPAG
jgi:iron(III) transport system ATP-binding protein